MNKKESINELFFAKKIARKLTDEVSSSNWTNSLLRRSANKIDSPFLAHKKQKFLAKAEEESFQAKMVSSQRKVIYNNIIDLVMWLDKYGNLTTHEKASIVGVHHVHIERLIDDHKESDLFLLIALHAELAGCEDWGRDHVLFNAYSYVQSKLCMSDKRFQDQIMDKLQEMAVENTGRPLQMYKQVINSNRSVDMVATKPKLRVVK